MFQVRQTFVKDFFRGTRLVIEIAGNNDLSHLTPRTWLGYDDYEASFWLG